MEDVKLSEKIMKYLRYGHRSSGNLYLKYLRKKGMRIGEGTIIFHPETTLIDETSPHMITIGNNVQITGEVTILSHDYGWTVLVHFRAEHDELYDPVCRPLPCRGVINTATI